MNKKLRHEPDYATTPGFMLKMKMEDRHMNAAELANRSGLSKTEISKLLNKPGYTFTPRIAARLGLALGQSSQYWIKAQQLYERDLATIENKKNLEKMTPWTRQFSYTELARRGAVPSTKDIVERGQNILKFFRVSDEQAWHDTYSTLHGAAREQQPSQLHDLSAWIRLGEIEADKLQLADYDKARFLTSLETIRTLTVEPVAQAFPKAVNLCAQAGVALVFVRELKGTHIFGFSRGKGRKLIQLSGRQNNDGTFWFTFFHEAAHIFKHGSKAFITSRDTDETTKDETEANKWAADFLIRPADWKQFTNKGETTQPAIIAFAKQIGIAPGIVLGRLQRENPSLYKRRYTLTKKLDALPG